MKKNLISLVVVFVSVLMFELQGDDILNDYKVGPNEFVLPLQIDKTDQILLKFNTPSSFKCAGAIHSYDPFIIECVPKNETLENWSEIITILMHDNKRYSFETYARRLKRSLERDESNLKFSSSSQLKAPNVQVGEISFDMSAFDVVKQKEIKGKRESTLQKVFIGNDFTYSVQYTVRYQNEAERQNLELKQKEFIDNCKHVPADQSE